MSKRVLALLMLLLALPALSGCTAGIGALNNKGGVTLPPAQTAEGAPTGDISQETAQTVLLYLPNAAGTRLIAQTEKLALPAARHPGEGALRRLLSFPGSDAAGTLGGEVTLQLSPVSPLEISGDTATVSLAASALALSHSELYIVCQAIANTLTQWGDILYVNVLVNSVQPGLDVGATVPAGCFTQNLTDSIDTLTAYAESLSTAADRRFGLSATLYYPTWAGRGILAETRAVSFEGRSKEQLISGLLSALSAGAQTLPNTPALPALESYLALPPEVTGIAVSGGQKAVLRFREDFNQALIACGVPRSVMMASLAYTLTTFLPGVGGLNVYIGEEMVTAVVPTGVYEGAGETIAFEDGLLRRADFDNFLLSNCTLYFGDGEGRLRMTRRPVPYYEARSPRYLINCLMLGPQTCDSVSGLYRTLPEPLGDADVLGVALRGDALSLNLSQGFYALCAGMNETEESLLVYALVNTLTSLPAVSRVKLFIAGAQPDTLCGWLYLPGEFMRNTGLIKNEP